MGFPPSILVLCPPETLDRMHEHDTPPIHAAFLLLDKHGVHDSPLPTLHPLPGDASYILTSWSTRALF